MACPAFIYQHYLWASGSGGALPATGDGRVATYSFWGVMEIRLERENPSQSPVEWVVQIATRGPLIWWNRSGDALQNVIRS